VNLVLISNKFLYWITSAALFLIFSLEGNTEKSCERIVSIAPSVTETVYALGLGEHIVGVTSYDTYPKEVTLKTQIGGFLDPNIEAIVALRPTRVIGLSEQESTLKLLQKLDLHTLAVDHRSIDTILNSFKVIADTCDVSSAGSVLFEKVSGALHESKSKTANVTIKKVLIVVSRDYESSDLREVYISGKDGMYDSLLSYVGGENVFKKEFGSITAVSLEGIYALNPDVIIEVLPQGFMTKHTKQNLKTPWKALSLIKAVRDDKIFFIDDDWATIPGPRIPLLLNKFFSILHPDLSS
jgi:iron complex transport system substrate-binding protein